jgi:pantoate kinase
MNSVKFVYRLAGCFYLCCFIALGLMSCSTIIKDRSCEVCNKKIKKAAADILNTPNLNKHLKSL